MAELLGNDLNYYDQNTLRLQSKFVCEVMSLSQTLRKYDASDFN